MKIGIFDPYLDDLGGGEKYMASIASCLSDEHEVSIFWDNAQDVYAISKRFSIDLSKVAIKKNIFSKNTGLFKRLLESKKYDAFIVLSDGSIPLVACKLFLHIQQPFVSLPGGPKLKLKLKRVKKIIVNSDFTKSYIDKALGVNSVVLYPHIEIKAKKTKKKNIILTVGKFRYKNTPLDDFKKQKVMIDAFKELVNNGLKDWEFIIVTGFSSEHKNEFEKLKDEVGEYPVKFFVDKTNDKLWDIYSEAKIYWHAAGFDEDLISHPEFAEHFGISTVEAMGAGAVPVVIRAGGQKEIVTDKSGFLWDNLEELKDKTVKLIKDDKLLERISAEAVLRADYFTGERFCRELKEIIK